MVKAVRHHRNVKQARIWYVHHLNVDVLVRAPFTGMAPIVVLNICLKQKKLNHIYYSIGGRLNNSCRDFFRNSTG